MGFEIEEETDRAIHDMKALINTVAIERINDELAKMICGDHFEKILSGHGDMIHEIIPEITIDGLFMKTLEIMGYVEPEIVLRLTALFINLVSDKNRSVDIGKILGRLRFSNEITEKVKALNRNFFFLSDMTQAELMRLINELGFDLTLDLISLKKAYVRVWESENMRFLDSLDEMTILVKTIKSKNGLVNLKSLQVNGDDLLSMGIKPGKRIKEILNYLLDGVIEGRFENSHDELIEHVKEYEISMDTKPVD
jgi:tRNA nucleotidyltransferase (CCA-adding enzyme)